MRILVLSDLHREQWREHAPLIDGSLSQPDVVVLAGDIDNGAKAVQWATEVFAELPVLYVPGNHEAYGSTLERVYDEIQSTCAASANVRFLNADECCIGPVRFLGATLWTDFLLFGQAQRDAAMDAAVAIALDYQRIRVAADDERLLTPEDTAQFHARHKAWLREKLSQPFAGKTVVITHMAPSMRSVAERYANELSSAAFASHLDELVGQADLWIHGHMHDSFDYRIGDCRVVCNPRGYRKRDGSGENLGFDSECVVEV
ncbi:metallophosphoesterase [Pseudomonas sp. NA-150]|uniref:metallophosphoesterase n=1 Tax=Pseudomonas sp. NA-150 TaxID=3367525 RepID=UPI0037C88EA8